MAKFPSEQLGQDTVREAITPSPCNDPIPHRQDLFPEKLHRHRLLAGMVNVQRGYQEWRNEVGILRYRGCVEHSISVSPGYRTSENFLNVLIQGTVRSNAIRDAARRSANWDGSRR